MKTVADTRQAKKTNTITPGNQAGGLPAVPVQMTEKNKIVKEEQPLQGKIRLEMRNEAAQPPPAKPFQFAGIEKEEPPAKPFQFAGIEKEEPLQMKSFQFAGIEKEEPLQMKPFQFAGIEKEEPMQMKPFQFAGIEKEEPMQRKPFQLYSEESQPLPIQKKPNNTGLPDNLKSGVENLSGIAMDDVKVHYNSAKAAQLQALAYAQGTDVHIGPGQERHLPHEAWHVVQQKQGRVQPTLQMKEGVAVNDDKGLENEADVMGDQAVQIVPKSFPIVNHVIAGDKHSYPIQRIIDKWDTEIATFYMQETNQNMKNTVKFLQDHNDRISVANYAELKRNIERGVYDHILPKHYNSKGKDKDDETPDVIKPNRVDFDSTSVGTEQELLGVKIKTITTGKIGEVLFQQIPILEYTTDMGSPEDGYTIEIKTKPTELNDKFGLQKRKEATSLLVEEIKKVSNKNQGVAGNTFTGGYELKIFVKKHEIISDSQYEPDINFSNQVTIGLSTEEIFSGKDEINKLIKDKAYWFDESLVKNMKVDGLEEKEKALTIYTYVASVIMKLARIVVENEIKVEGPDITGNLFDPSIKNKWGVLPRTAPWTSLDVLTPDDKEKVKKNIRELKASGDVTQAILDAARNHITNKLSLAGHEYDGKVKGKHASLFEFRSPPEELSSYDLLHKSDSEKNAKKVDIEDIKRFNSSLTQILRQTPKFKAKKEEDDD